MVLALGWYALSPLDDARIAIVVGVGLVATMALLWPAVRRWLPDAACQVREERLALGTPGGASFMWGFELGVGVRTFAVTPALFVLPALALSQSAPGSAALVAGLYGLARGSVIACFAVVRARRDPSLGLPGLGLERAMRIPLVVAIGAAVLAAA